MGTVALRLAQVFGEWQQNPAIITAQFCVKPVVENADEIAVIRDIRRRVGSSVQIGDEYDTRFHYATAISIAAASAAKTTRDAQ
jgi:L-alanine-DL-glutamate epimerase-like enolase superfamily enzyme